MRRNLRRWFRARKAGIVVAVIFAAIGYVAGLGTRLDLNPNFQFDDKIDPVALLSLAVTVILVLVIASILDRQREAEKSAKVILLKRAEELHTLVAESAAAARSGGLLYTDAAAMLKRVELTINRLSRLMEGIAITFDPEVSLSILKHIEGMDALLTDTPTIYPDSGQLPALRVENGTLLFDEQRAREVDAAFEDLRDKLTELEFAIING